MKKSAADIIQNLAVQLPDLLKTYSVPGVSIAVFTNETHHSCFAGRISSESDKNVDHTSLFHACSMSKLVTSLMVLKLVEQGRLELDTPVNQYLKNYSLDYHPELACSGLKADVTLANLLNHSAGLTDHCDGFGPLVEGDTAPDIDDILSGQTRYNPEKLVVSSEVGARLCYSDAGYCVIEKVLSDMTGLSFKALAKELIFDPLSLTLSCFDYSYVFNQVQIDNACDDVSNVAVGHDKTGKVIAQKRATYPYLASAGLWTTSHELNQIMVALSQGLIGYGRLGISSTLLKRMINPEGPETWSGLGVFVQKDEKQTLIFSMGWGVGFQCKLVSDLTENKHIVVLTNSDPGCDQDNALTGKLIQLIKKEVSF